MKRSELFFSAITVPLDYIALILAAIAAYALRYWPAIQNIRPVIFNLPFGDYFSIVLVVGLAWLVIFALIGLYQMGVTNKLSEELARIFVACLAGLALVLAVMVFTRYLFDSRFIILASWALAIIFVSVERLVVRILQLQVLKLGIGIHRVIIVGNGQTAQVLAKEFSSRQTLGYKVIDQIPKFDATTAQYLQELVDQNKFDEIIQVNPNLSLQETQDLVGFTNEHHLVFKYTADLLGTQLINFEVRTIAGTPVVEVKRTRLDGWGRIYKRIFDIIGSTIFIVLSSPLMIIAAIAIKLDSPGPILFKYKRIGQYGKPFTYFKFRSMIKDAHKYRFDQKFLAQHQNLRDGTPMIKFINDPRITRVGKIIRRWSIDELPELFLVLIGKMSLVGPRPHEVEEVAKYHGYHKKVLTLKPGITGLGQVSGRSDLNFDDEIKLDTYYIENWSLAFDWQILLRTPMAILRRRNTA